MHLTATATAASYLALTLISGIHAAPHRDVLRTAVVPAAVPVAPGPIGPGGPVNLAALPPHLQMLAATGTTITPAMMQMPPHVLAYVQAGGKLPQQLTDLLNKGAFVPPHVFDMALAGVPLESIPGGLTALPPPGPGPIPPIPGLGPPPPPGPLLPGPLPIPGPIPAIAPAVVPTAAPTAAPAAAPPSHRRAKRHVAVTKVSTTGTIHADDEGTGDDGDDLTDSLEMEDYDLAMSYPKTLKVYHVLNRHRHPVVSVGV